VSEVAENINFAEIILGEKHEKTHATPQLDSQNNTASQQQPQEYPLVRHHCVSYLSYSSDYIYNTYSYLGNGLIAHKVTHRNTDRFEVKDLEKWSYLRELRHKGHLYYEFKKETSNGTPIILRVPENNKEKLPIVIKHPRGTVTLQLLQRNTTDKKVVLEGYTKMTVRIDTYGSFHVFDILHDLTDLPNRNVDFTYNLLRIKLLDPEVYVRFKRYHQTEDGRTVDYLLRMDKLLSKLRVYGGVKEKLDSRGKYSKSSQHSHVVGIKWKGHNVEIKVYTAKYHPERDPKLEIIMKDGITLTFDEFRNLEKFIEKVKEEVIKEIKIASGILGAIVEYCQLILTWDVSEDSKYFSHKASLDKDFLRYLRGVDIWDFLYTHNIPFGFDDLDFEILENAAKRTLVTIPQLSEALSKSESTIRRRIRKLVKAGLLNGTKGKSTNYYWLAVYGDLPELSPEEKRTSYIDRTFIEKSAEIIKNKIEKAPITGIDTRIDDVDLINMGVILWGIGSGWNKPELLFSFLKIVKRELSLKRLSEKYIRRYIKILNSLRIIQTRKFGVRSRRHKKNESEEPVKPVVQYYLLEPEIKKLLHKVDYFSFFGF
jgi:hypothetical protein